MNNIKAWIVKNGVAWALKTTGSPLLDAFHGITDNEGDLVNTPDGLAMAYSASLWAWRCIRLRGQTLAALKWEVCDYEDNAVDPDNALQKILGPKNYRLIRNTEYDLMIWGKAFWEPAANLSYIQRLNPSTMEIVTSSDSGIEGFLQRIGGEVVADWYPEDLVYYFDYDPNDDFGSVSPLSMALRAANVGINIDKWVEAFFENDATPSGLLTTEQEVDDIEVEKVEHWWNKLFRGTKNKHRTAVLNKGFTWTPISPAPKDLVMDTLRLETRRDICASFGVPMTLAGAWDAATYQSAPEQRRSFYTEAVLPEADFVANELTKQLCPRWAPGYKVRADHSDVVVLQEDKLEVTQRATSGFSLGVMSLNDSRKLEGLDTYEKDYHLIPGVGLVSVEDIASGNIPGPPGFPAPGMMPFGATQFWPGWSPKEGTRPQRARPFRSKSDD